MAVGDTIILVGYPFGLPKKTDPNGVVKDVTPTLIRAYVDSYGGNSGSPLFDTSGLLVGILVGGAPDFTVADPGCEVSNVCPGGQGCTSLGEHIVPICVMATHPSIAPLGLCDIQKLEIPSSAPVVKYPQVMLTLLLGVVLLVL
jgi:hypothetical protein